MDFNLEFRRGGGGGGELAYVVIWGCVIILGTFLGVLSDFWVPFWYHFFLVKFDFFRNKRPWRPYSSFAF